MRALLAAARCEPTRLDEGDLAFRLAPRINAAGRLYRADAGVELFLTEDEGRAGRSPPSWAGPTASGGRPSARSTPRPRRPGASCPTSCARRRAGAGGGGLAPRRDRDRRLAPGRAPSPPGRRRLARRRGRWARLGPQHPRLRPAGGAGGVLRAPGRLRRPPRGRRAVAARREPRAFRDAFAAHATTRAGSRGPAADRADRRDGRRRRPRARPGRGAGPAGAVRDGEPRRAADGPLGAGQRRAHDGRRQARPLQPPQRLPPGPRRRLRALRPRRRGGGPGRRRGAARGQPLERLGRAAGRAARAVSAGARAPAGGRGRDAPRAPCACEDAEWWRRFEAELAREPRGALSTG